MNGAAAETELPAAAAWLTGRLRSWPPSSWRLPGRAEVVARTCRRLAELATRSDGRPRPAVADAGWHARADQLVVLARDAVEAGVPLDVLDAEFGRLAQALGFS